MTRFSHYQFPPPESWETFEELCCDLWRRIWKDPGAQRNGRQGQPQCGVDVFGRPGGGGEWAGVQCKLKSQLTGAALGRPEIEDEVEKARQFNPSLSSFTIATTALRSAAAQQTAREITKQQLERGSFPVEIFAWEEIAEELSKHRDLIAKYYPGSHLGDRSLDDYLGTLWARLLPVPLLALGGGTSRRDDIPLSAVYTALDVAARVRLGRKLGAGPASKRKEPAVSLELRGEAGYLENLRRRFLQEAEALEKGRGRLSLEVREEGPTRRCTAVEAVAAAPRLVLLGAPGSGKSTFARHLALCLAGDLLGKSEADLKRLNPPAEDGVPADPKLLPWPHGALVPIFVELKRLVRSDAFPGESEAGESGHLLRYLDAEAAGPESGRFGEVLRDRLGSQGEGCLLLLDGLDETSAAAKQRERLKHVIGSWTRRYPRCRVLVTSRPYAYEPESPWRLDRGGFEEASLAPFDRPKIERYVDGWYALLVERGQIGSEQAERWGGDLKRQIARTGYLRPLAERPLMLSMMADLHAESGGRFRGGRAALYERSVELLLDRWNEIRDLEEGRSLGELLGMEVGEIRRALERLAYEEYRSTPRADRNETPEITDKTLWKALDRERSKEKVVDERRVMNYLHQRSAILFAESPEVFRFPHRSYQEYLAACHLVKNEFPDRLARELESDPVLWREVVLLAAGQVADTPFTVWGLLEALVPQGPAGAPNPNETCPAGAPDETSPAEKPEPGHRAFLKALYAALAVEENRLDERIEERYRPRLERIRRWQETALELGALSPVDRAAAGRALARLGDRRPGVGLDESGMPDIAWCDVPSGKFLMGSTDRDELALAEERPQREVELAAFRIARYPVTNVQYGAFVKDGGYGNRWRRCWTKAGWKWKGDRQGPDDDLPPEYLLANHPRVNVSWYEAVAFCGWLGERLGREVRLPSEAEWEKAARGEEGRIYPWGEEWEEGRCNSEEAGIGTTCAVGSFPLGKSPYGVADTSGNVWEWCSTKWRDSYKPGAGDDDLAGGASRVFRGGAFLSGRGSVRCAFRANNEPDNADRHLGFRVSAPI